MVDERACDLEAALHAGGERAHQPLAPVGELDQRQHLVDALAAQRSRHAVDEAVEVQVLVEREAVVEARLLEHDAEARAAPSSGS